MFSKGIPPTACPSVAYPSQGSKSARLWWGIGVVLMQDNHPIAFISRSLNVQQQSLSTYEKELLAIVFAVQKWRHYLLPKKFVIRTDHRSLKYILDQRLDTAFQQKWLVKLIEFDFCIE